MAGLAKTQAFMLGTATVMVGPQSALFDLNETAHSIGLVKNFALTAEPSYTDLTQGVKNTIVFSVLTGNPVRASMEAYEFTAKNLAYGLGIDGSAMASFSTETTVSTGITGNDGTPVVSVVVADAAAISVGQYIILRNLSSDDRVTVRKVTGKTGNTLTVDPGFKAGLNFPVGSRVSAVNVVGVGSKAEQPFLSAKIVGVVADGTPMVILIPKIRVQRGFNLNFSTENYGNMPFEFTVYDLVATDPFYTEFNGDSARIMSAR